MEKTDWENLFKVKIANSDDSFQKHEVIKLLIVMKILNKHKKRKWIRIYTEFKINGLKPDIYFENLKTKSVICYEVQKEMSKKYIDKKTKEYSDYEVPFFDSVDLVLVSLKEAPNDIRDLNKWLDKYIF